MKNTHIAYKYFTFLVLGVFALQFVLLFFSINNKHNYNTIPTGWFGIILCDRVFEPIPYERERTLEYALEKLVENKKLTPVEGEKNTYIIAGTTTASIEVKNISNNLNLKYGNCSNKKYIHVRASYELTHTIIVRMIPDELAAFPTVVDSLPTDGSTFTDNY